ncbi:hypothetical protein AB6C60_07675 [Vibrio cyclitrophicus]
MAKYKDTEWLTKNKKELLYNTNSRNYHNYLINLLAKSDLRSLKSIFLFLNKNEKLKHLTASCKVDNPSQLCTLNITGASYYSIENDLSSDHIISWVQLALESNSDKINYFIRKKKEFEKHRLLSQTKECFSILNEIEQKLGYSWWLIESKAALIQECEGKKNRVRYIKELISLSRNRGVFYWVAQEISERNDEKTQENRYCDRLFDTFESLDIPKSLSETLRYRITKRSDIDILPTLFIESFGSIVDLYERFIVASTLLVNHEDTPQQVIRSVRSIIKKIECRVLKNCLILVDDNLKNRELKNYKLSEQGMLYLSGKFEEAESIALESIYNNPSDMESIIILANAESDISNNGEPQPLIIRLISDLRELRNFNESTPESFSRIRKFIWNNIELGLSRSVNSTILSKSNLSSIEVTSINDYFYHANKIDIFSSPLLGYSFDDSVNICGPVNDIKKLIQLVKDDKHEDVVKLVNDINLKEGKVYSNNQVYLLNTLCSSLIETGDTFRCIKTIVDNAIKNKFLLSILPIKSLVEKKRWREFRNYKENIELSIILHFYLILYEDSLQKTNLGFAWDWFRKTCGVLNVSEITYKNDSLVEKEKLVYYLSEVSTPEVMESHTEGLDTPLQTLISRSQILTKLIELDKSSDKSYEKEQVSLLKTISIQKGLDKLNQNKLYVDENIIKSWAQRELESSYEKYQDTLISPELSISNLDQNNFTDDSEEFFSFIDELVNIKNEEHVILFNMISNEYLMNKQGGLNLFLSMRIRHGKLESTLRKPLSDSSLITKMSDSDDYLDNNYWVEKLGLDGEQAKTLNEKFIKISSLFDVCINDFKEKRIRCYSQKNQYGFFYINPSFNDVLDLKNKIASGVNFSTFCDESIKLCRRSVEATLPTTKVMIDRYMIQQVINELNQLLEFSESKGYKPLSEAIKNTRNKFKKTGDTVKEWFNFDDVDVNAKSLTVDDCVDISLTNIQNVHSDFSLDIERIISPSLINLKLSDIDSNNLNEIFYILLDNIYKRSGLKESVKIRIRLSKTDDKHIKVTVVNEVAEGIINAVNIDKLNEIRGIISTGLYETKASDEGNSGLIKIKNMNHTGKSSIRFDFKFNAFIVNYLFKML